MPRTCTICSHPDLEEIDRALVDGVAYRSIARQFAVSADAVYRHKAEHLPLVLIQAKQAAAAAHGDSLLDQLRSLQDTTLDLLRQAEAAGKVAAAIMAVGQARGNLELMAKLMHELDDRPQVNLLVAPEWLAVRAALVEVLRPFPEAAVLVARRLAMLEAG